MLKKLAPPKLLFPPPSQTEAIIVRFWATFTLRIYRYYIQQCATQSILILSHTKRYSCLRRITNLIIIIAMPASSAHIRKAMPSCVNGKVRPNYLSIPHFLSFLGFFLFPIKSVRVFPAIISFSSAAAGGGGKGKRSILYSRAYINSTSLSVYVL